MTTDRTLAELEEIRAVLTQIAAAHPTPVLLAMLDQLVEVSCGSNPWLRDAMRLQFYRGVLRRLGPLSNADPTRRLVAGGCDSER